MKYGFCADALKLFMGIDLNRLDKINRINRIIVGVKTNKSFESFIAS